MLKSILKNITVAFLTAIMLVSTMGFSVNTLYCYCLGQSEASIFEIKHHCTQKNDEEKAFEKLPPCCKKMAMAKCCSSEKKHSEGHDCTKKDKKYVKADLKFLEIFKEKQPVLDVFVVKQAVLPTVYAFTPAKIESLQSKIPTRPPPQYFGRWLLNFIQVYRC